MIALSTSELSLSFGGETVLKNISFAQAPHGIPELVASALVVLLHIWKRSTLISIVGGTACYMLLVQMVF